MNNEFKKILSQYPKTVDVSDIDLVVVTKKSFSKQHFLCFFSLLHRKDLFLPILRELMIGC